MLTIDTIGRKPLQVFGFLILTILFCVMGFVFHRLSKTAMLALYVVAQFFFNWGPNTTTFVIPGECFPTRYRSTAHGMSAAMGKIGAIIAQVISIPILSRDAPPNCSTTARTSSDSCSPWFNRLMQIFALFMLCGTLVSLVCIPETKGITLEELSGEDTTPDNAGRSDHNGSMRGRISVGTDRDNGHCRGVLNPRVHRKHQGRPAADTYSNTNNGATSFSSSTMVAGFVQDSRRWNPFAGGRQAGFSIPRMGNRRHHRRRIFGRWIGGTDISMWRATRLTNSHRYTGGPSPHSVNGGIQDGVYYTGATNDAMPNFEQAVRGDAWNNYGGSKAKSAISGHGNSMSSSNSGTTSRANSGRQLLSRSNTFSHDQLKDSSASGLTKSTKNKTESSKSRQDVALRSRRTSRGGEGRRDGTEPLHPVLHAETNSSSVNNAENVELTFGGLAYPPRRTGKRVGVLAKSDDGPHGAHDIDSIAGGFLAWGTDWGRIDQSGTRQSTPENALEDIRLRDVGHLLRERTK